MDLAFGFFMLLWGLLGRSRTTPEQAPRTRPRPALPSSTPAWPAVVPSELPPFPGSGWEPDEPPPQVVQQRAGALLSSLWAKGKGSYKIEQTAGRWIAYSAGITAGNKHGVIAYRVKRPRELPAPAARPSAHRAQAPSVEVLPAVDIEEAPLPSSLTPLPVLRRGDGIAPHAPVREVRLLQNYLHIPVDGRFGADTDKAVRDFQKSHGLAVDGVVGKATWAALFTPPRQGSTGTWA